MALFKTCSYCRSKYKIGESCPNRCREKIQKAKKKKYDKKYDKYKRNKESKKIYSSKQWKTLTKECKARFKGIDVYTYYKYN